ncbi:MAG: universal stress protein [Gammaproteobacteria bacterium]
MDTYSHILAAVDLTADSEALVRRTVAIANRFEARLSLAHVVEYVLAEPAGETLLPPPISLEPELASGAERQLAELAVQAGATNADRHVAVGSIPAELSRLVAELKADLLITGAHERHWLALFTGGTERSLLKHAPCDVLVIRLRKDPENPEPT